MKKIPSWFFFVKEYAVAHKTVAAIGALVVLYAGYHAYSIITAPSTAPRYVTTTVSTSTVVAFIDETGQVSASSNIDVQSKSSGEILSMPVTAGQHVDAGAALAYLDPTTAEQNVSSARQALELAQIALAKLQEPATDSALTAAENAVAAAQANLVNAHETGYNDVSSSFLDLPNAITSLNSVLHGNTVPGRTNQQNESAYSDMIVSYDSGVVQYETIAENAYQAAYAAYTQTLSDFKSTPRDADDAKMEALITESYQTAALISDALKASTNFLNFVNTTLSNHQLTLPSTLAAHISSLTGYTTTTNGHVAALSSDAASVTSSERSLAAAKASLAELQAGADPLDIQSSQLSVQMKQDALSVAEQDLADTVVRAPFSGTVAKLDVQQYQTIGSGTAIATMVSDNQSVAVSVNEVDAAKLKVGQKATLAFDALPGISIAGTVSSVNTIGTVSSGVVSYGAVITFDTPNPSVKPGMSATANIVIGTETGLLVPQSAVKTSGGQKYVEVFNPPLAGSTSSAGAVSGTAPERITVVTGLSDDTNIVIENGLAAGAQVVERTIAGAAAAPTSAAQSTSIFGAGRGGIGGGARVLTP
ncbi:MAG: efflux RND transporter periplasmic adaptor subunit [Patescibacteria group bacterium]|nr:efflux RND transporter periplasmic adaptor subunit [Patescibacteria group bacterium]